MKLHKANPSAEVVGVDEQVSRSNYFIGNDPKKWHLGVPTFAKVKFMNVYPGIDLVYYGNQPQLEYDFVVAPGANPDRIRFDVSGAKRITKNSGGDLVFRTAEGTVEWRKPNVYQYRNGSRRRIGAEYTIRSGRFIAFDLDAYDSTRPLIIDPAVVYSTYLGGTAGDHPYGMGIDNFGNIYLSGYTTSLDFPTTAGAFQVSAPGDGDVFVSKMNSTGSDLVYSTYIGGTMQDQGLALAVDSSGNAYVTGQTSSTDFPTTPGAFQSSYAPSFVTKLDPTGSTLVYSSYLGGSNSGEGLSIAVDNMANAYVTGWTYASDFPVTPGAFQTMCSCNGSSTDAFLTVFNTAGSALIYSTFLGGSQGDQGNGVIVDSSGEAYVVGTTSSPDFPVTLGAFQDQLKGGEDAFLTKFTQDGSGLVFSTLLGGTGGEEGRTLALDPSSGNVYLAGNTTSDDFPVTPGVFQPSHAGGWEGFVAKLNAAGSGLLYATYLGGTNSDFLYAITFDRVGNAYLAGQTSSTDFPVTGGAFQQTCPANCTNYTPTVSEISPNASVLLYSTYLSGNGYGQSSVVAVTSTGDFYVTGYTEACDFPVTPGAFQPTCGSRGDVFLTRFTLGEQVWPLSLSFGEGQVGRTSQSRPVMLTNSVKATLNISGISVTGLDSSDFNQTNDCGTSLTSGASCTINVSFSPSLTGDRSASISVTDNAANSPQMVTLSGIGVAPAVTLLPTQLIFPTTVVFTSSPTKAVMLTNTGQGVLTITSILATSPFIQTNTCGTTIAPGASCTITVRFKPSNKGQVAGSLAITDNAPGSPQRVQLSGVGTYIQTNPTSIGFGNQPVGTTSFARQTIVTNQGHSTVSISSIAITGTNASDFAETNTCGASLASGASCKVVVTFTPSAKGKRTANVAITDNGGGSPQLVGLSGTGT
jgi:hypothetical protein